jgi:thioredoxin-related protein
MLSLAAMITFSLARAEFRIESLDYDFPSEIKAAAEDGKSLVIMFHQNGCPYCDKMRTRVFPDPRVDRYYSRRFVLIESNIRGSLAIITPRGEEITEKEFARRLRVRATPVFVFFDKEGNNVFRVTGFLDANRFAKAGRYVADGIYKRKVSFFRYLQQ